VKIVTITTEERLFDLALQGFMILGQTAVHIWRYSACRTKSIDVCARQIEEGVDAAVLQTVSE